VKLGCNQNDPWCSPPPPTPHSRQDLDSLLKSTSPLRAPNWIIDVTRPHKCSGSCTSHTMNSQTTQQLCTSHTMNSQATLFHFPQWKRFRNFIFGPAVGTLVHIGCYCGLRNPQQQQSWFVNMELEILLP